MQACDSTCSFCAREFFAWRKERVRLQDNANGRSGPGSFNAAAATSIRPPPDVQRDSEEPDAVRCMVLGAGRVEHGEDLPGSWFQQSNGGRRTWSTASGEINVEP